MSGGSVLEHLLKNAGSLRTTPYVLHRMVLNIVHAMAYLEGKSVVHRDLAARNCLVGEGRVVKVADFGLARLVPDGEYTASAHAKFAVKWAAPEVVEYRSYSCKSDVWSFGILSWEIWSLGTAPYAGIVNRVVIEGVPKGMQPERPELAGDGVWEAMRHCWVLDAKARPTFKELSTIIGGIEVA